MRKIIALPRPLIPPEIQHGVTKCTQLEVIDCHCAMAVPTKMIRIEVNLAHQRPIPVTKSNSAICGNQVACVGSNTRQPLVNAGMIVCFEHASPVSRPNFISLSSIVAVCRPLPVRLLHLEGANMTTVLKWHVQCSTTLECSCGRRTRSGLWGEVSTISLLLQNQDGRQ